MRERRSPGLALDLVTRLALPSGRCQAPLKAHIEWLITTNSSRVRAGVRGQDSNSVTVPPATRRSAGTLPFHYTDGDSSACRPIRSGWSKTTKEYGGNQENGYRDSRDHNLPTLRSRRRRGVPNSTERHAGENPIGWMGSRASGLGLLGAPANCLR